MKKYDEFQFNPCSYEQCINSANQNRSYDGRNMNFPDFNFKASVNGNPIMDTNNMQMMPMGNNMNLGQPMIDMSTLDMNAEVENQNKNAALFGTYEGYMKGNMFQNMYVPYKNYRPMKLVPNNEKAELLLRTNELTFASHELRLYLDVFPNDTRMISLFNQFRNGANEAIKEYEKKYGPIEWDSLSTPNQFSWATTAWPWEMGVM